MKLKARLMRAQEVALCIVRKWWRPMTCIALAGGAWVNLVVIPLRTGAIDLNEAAAFVGALAAAFGVREWGKFKGTAD